MLPDRHLQLLTAYVDGELTTRERNTAVRLLRQSSEARTALDALAGDARRIRDLTRLRLGPGFPRKVMQTIARLGVRPTVPLRPPAPTLSPWVGLGVAAVVFLLIAAGSYWYFLPQQAVRVGGPVLVKARLALDAAELAKEVTKTRLTQEFRRSNAFHLNIAVHDMGRALSRLKGVLEETGIKAVGAGGPALRPNQQASPTSYLVYAENLSPEELTNILHLLARPTAPPGKGAKTEAALDQVLVNLMTSEDRHKLATLLGVDASTLQPPDPGNPPPDPVDMIAKPEGQGSRPRPRNPVTRARERLAVVLAVNAGVGADPARSAEVQQFVKERRQQRPGTLQVLLVVHEASV
jgi:anti-sigma factor RsiW